MRKTSLSAAESANLVHWTPERANFFETYYLKWHDPKSESAGWVRYTLLDSARGGSESAVWGAFIDTRDPAKNVLVKQSFPLTAVVCTHDRFSLRIADSGMSHRRAWGTVETSGNRLSWDVRTESDELLFKHVPWPLYSGPVPATKFLAPFCWSRISGMFSVNGRTMPLRGVPAHQAHFWGRKQVLAWTWGNCAGFREDPDFGFEGISGRVRIGAFRLPPLNAFGFHWEGKCFRSNSLVRAMWNRSEHDLENWKFEARAGGYVFRGDLRSRPEDMILYRHVDPDGESRYSHNTFSADLRIRLLRNGKEIKSFSAEHSAAFEVAGPGRDARVTQVISL